jgi:geranylgeranyl pyrophosphate synthase
VATARVESTFMSQLALPPGLRADLERVEAIIGARVATRAAVLQLAGQHIQPQGQTRLRAALTLAAAQLGRYDLADVQHAAAAVELIFSATRVHDDLIDAAEQRRGQAAERRWDGDVALMVGDYLFALAAAEMALAPDPRIIAYFSHAVMQICEAQLTPVQVAAPLEEARGQYLAYAGYKTAALVEAGCKAGVVCGGGTPEQVEALGRFGQALGMAVQIADDVRDLRPGADGRGGGALRQGRITLPLIYAADASADPLLAAAVEEPADSGRLQAALQIIRRSGAAERAAADARRYAEQALAALEPFPDTPARQLLRNMALAEAERVA